MALIIVRTSGMLTVGNQILVKETLKQLVKVGGDDTRTRFSVDCFYSNGERDSSKKNFNQIASILPKDGEEFFGIRDAPNDGSLIKGENPDAFDDQALCIELIRKVIDLFESLPETKQDELRTSIITSERIQKLF